MNERNQRIRLGIFVAGALIALAALVILFGKRPDLLKSRDRFFVEFANAPNLQPGTPVRRSGVKIGEVARVELNPTGTVIVELAVDKRYPPLKNENVAISQSLLSGDAMIDFVTDLKRPGEVEPYTPEQTREAPIKGLGPLDTRQAVDTAQDLGKSARETLEQIRESINKFTSVAPEVDRTLKEYALLSQTIRQAIPEIQQTNDSIRRLADGTRGSLPNANETLEKAKVAIDNWNRVGERMNVILAANEERISKALEELAAIIANANKLLGDENQKLVTDLLRNAGAMFSTDNQQAVASLLKNANTLLTEENAKNLTETLRNIKSASEKLDATLKDGPKTVEQLNSTLAKAEAAIDGFRKFTEGFGDGGDLARNLTYTSGQLGLLIKDVRDLMKGYATADGTIQRLLTDPSLYNQANNVFFALNRVMPKLDLIMEDLKDFSDKIARHPNQLIFDNRGGGLKGSPFAPSQPSVMPRMQHGGPVTTPPIVIPQR